MSVEPQTEDEPVKKLLIDDSSDFRFHAAYLIYSEGWDQASSGNDRNALNEIITSLSKNEIDYESFYARIERYRSKHNGGYHGSKRVRIETQKKREWRRKEARSRRNSRHRK